MVAIDTKTFSRRLCTSSATVGHSFSMGKADAAVVISKTCAVADAFAAAFYMWIKKTEDITPHWNG